MIFSNIRIAESFKTAEDELDNLRVLIESTGFLRCSSDRVAANRRHPMRGREVTKRFCPVADRTRVAFTETNTLRQTRTVCV